MKRLFALIIAAALVMTLFYGCKGKGGEEETTDGEAATDSSGFYLDDSKIPLEIGDRID